jgi:hypothetical protein
MDLISILWLFIILASLQPVIQRRFLEASRKRALSRLASERGSTIVTLIHRQETMSFLGFPIVRYINIEELLERYMKSAQATEVARILSTGTWTHDHPLGLEELEALGVPVKVGVPRGVRGLMQLYPQPQGRQASVEYAPSPRQPREIPANRPRD